MKRPSETISFRADSELVRLIDAAREPFGLSRGDWVRGITTSHLHRGDDSEVKHHLMEIRELLSELIGKAERTDSGLARMLFTFLTVGASVPVEDAKTTVRKVFPD